MKMLTHQEPKLNSELYSFNPPTFPDIADLPYPPAIQKEIKALNKAWDAWVQADTDHIIAADKLKTAKQQFDEDITHAANNGEPMPAIPNFDELETAVKYQKQVALNLRSQFDQAKGKLGKAIRENQNTIIELAINKAEQGAEHYKHTIERINTELIEADDARRKAYDGLIMVRQYVEQFARYDTNFTMSDVYKLPRKDETHAKSVIHLLNRYLEVYGEPQPDLAGTPTVANNSAAIAATQ